MSGMPIDKPIKMGPNSYYFHGELWTAEEITERWGSALIPTCTSPESQSPASRNEEKTEPSLTSA
jgi:hypothetical protein